jgi:hypothetical protein
LKISTHTTKDLEKVLVFLGNYKRSLEVSEEGRTRGFMDQLYGKSLITKGKSSSINLNDIYSIATKTTLVEFSLNVEENYISGEIKSTNVLDIVPFNFI